MQRSDEDLFAGLDAAGIAQRLETERDDAVLCRLIDAATRTGNRELQRVLDQLVERPEPAVALAALQGVLHLAGSQRASLAERLASIGTGHPAADVRFTARRALGELRTTPPQSWPMQRLSPEDVSERLGNTLAEARLMLLDRVAAQRDPLLADPLAGRLGSEQDARVLARMISLVKELGSLEHAAAIRPLLKHPDDRVCANAVEAIVHLAGELDLPELLPLLVREDNRLRANLMMALRGRYEEQVAGFVRRMLREKRFSFRVSAVYCARYLDAADVYPDVLRVVAEDDHPSVLAAAIAWVRELGPEARRERDLAELGRARAEVASLLGPAQPDPAVVIPSPPPEPVAAPAAPLPLVAGAGAVTSGHGTSGAVTSGASPRLTPRSRPGSRPISAASRPAPPPSVFANLRVAISALALVLLGLGGMVAWRLRSEERAEAREREKAVARLAAISAGTVIPALVMRVSEAGTAHDVEIVAQGQAYTLSWPATLGPVPKEGKSLMIRAPRMIQIENLGFRVTVEEAKQVP